MPASLTTASDSPASRRETTRWAMASSLWSCSATSGLLMPKCDNNWPVWRVSSAQISATDRSTSCARGLRSARLPMGVATTYKVAAGVLIIGFSMVKGRIVPFPQPGTAAPCRTDIK
ncbi:hypothetical protein D3C72_2030230 [compost metagenome]